MELMALLTLTVKINRPKQIKKNRFKTKLDFSFIYIAYMYKKKCFSLHFIKLRIIRVFTIR